MKTKEKTAITYECSLCGRRVTYTFPRRKMPSLVCRKHGTPPPQEAFMRQVLVNGKEVKRGG